MTLWKQHRHSGIWAPYNKPLFGWELDREHPLVKHMTGCWPLNEGGGPNAFNWCNGDDNQLTGCTWAPGGILCDADYERIVVASAADYLGNQGSIAFSFRTTATPDYLYFYVVGDDYTDFSLLAYPPADYRVYMYANGDAGLGGAVANLQDGKKHSVVVTWDTSGPYRRFYIDGVLNQEDTDAFSMPSLTTEALNVGARADSVGRYCGGVLGYFHVFDKALSISDIIQLHHEPWSMFKPKPVAKYFYVPSGEVVLQTVDGGTFASMVHVDGGTKGSLTHVDGADVS